MKAIDHTCAITHGNSGGPLVNANGRVIGVNYCGGATFSFAIPAPVIRREFRELFFYRLREGAVRDMAPAVTTDIASVTDDRDTVYQRLVELTMPQTPWGSTVRLGAGKFQINDLLQIRARGLHLKGAGRDKTQIVLGPTGRIYCRAEWLEISDLTIVGGQTGGLEAWNEYARAKSLHPDFGWFTTVPAQVRIDPPDVGTVHLHDLNIDTQDLAGLGVTSHEANVDVTNVQLTIAEESETPSLLTVGSDRGSRLGQPRFACCRIQLAMNYQYKTQPVYTGCTFFVKGREFKRQSGMLSVHFGADVMVEGCWFDVPPRDQRDRSPLAGISMLGGRLTATDNLFDLWAAAANHYGYCIRWQSFCRLPAVDQLPGGVLICPASAGMLRNNRFQAHRGQTSVHDLPWPDRKLDSLALGQKRHKHKLTCYNYAVAIKAVPENDAKAKRYATTDGWVIQDNLFDNTGWYSCHRDDPETKDDPGLKEAERAWYKMMAQNRFIRSSPPPDK